MAERQAAIDAHYEEMQEEGLANPAPQYPDLSSDTVGPPAPLFDQSEIVEGGEYPDPSYDFVNVYATPSKDHNIVLYAGSLRDNLSQGVLLVWDEDTIAQEVVTTEYLAPKGVGGLSIVSATGLVVTLVTTDGATYTFDIAAGMWN